MTAATAIQEQVRILALQIGVREAARKLNLNEDTVCSWSKRYNWHAPTTKPGPITSASKLQADTVGNAVADELAENERETRLSLSRYARKAAQDSEKATLRDSPYVKQAAQTAAIVHRWDQKDQGTGNVVVNVAILGIQPSEVQATAHTLDTGVSG